MIRTKCALIRRVGYHSCSRPSQSQLHPFAKLTIDKLAAKAVETITESGRTGQIGDGKIFVLNLDSAVRIRTGESGEEAL